MLSTANEHIDVNGAGAGLQEAGHVFMWVNPVSLAFFFETGLPSCTAGADLSSLARGNDAV